MSYKKSEIYHMSFELFIKAHRFTLKLPKHELYELGSQLRRSSNSINSNIVEGYGRRSYKKEFIRYLIYSHASNDETNNHLLCVSNVYPEYTEQCEELIQEYNTLGKRINKYISYVNLNWKTNN